MAGLLGNLPLSAITGQTLVPNPQKTIKIGFLVV
jgi:hypothetical protein